MSGSGDFKAWADKVHRSLEHDRLHPMRFERCPHCGNKKSGYGKQLRAHRARCSKNPKNAYKLKNV